MIEVEFSPSVNYFGIQLGISAAFGIDNRGHADIALGVNYEPNTDTLEDPVESPVWAAVSF